MRLPSFTQLQPRERLLAAVGGVAVLLVLVDRVVLSPWVRHGQAVRQEIRLLERVLQDQQQLLGRRDQIVAELAQYQRYLRPAIADDLQMADLLKEIEDLGGQSHIKLHEVKPLAGESDDLAKRYALDVRFDCTQEAWVEFIYRLESSPSAYEIVRASLSLPEEAHGQLEGYVRLVSASMRGGAAGPSSTGDTKDAAAQ